MIKKTNYIFKFFICSLGLAIIPQLLMRPIWNELIAVLTLFFNTLILPVSLIVLLNKNFRNKRTLISYTIIILCVLISIYISLLNYSNSLNTKTEIFLPKNIDTKSLSVVYLEATIAIGIVSIAFFWNWIKKRNKDNKASVQHRL